MFIPLPLQDLPAQGLGTLAGAHDFVIDHPIFTSIITKSRALFMDRHTPIQEGPVADIFRGLSIQGPFVRFIVLRVLFSPFVSHSSSTRGMDPHEATPNTFLAQNQNVYMHQERPNGL